MARLTNVFQEVDGTEITHEGKIYEAVEGAEKKGDIAMIVKPWGTQELGAFYRVIAEDHFMYSEGEKHVHIDGEEIHASNWLNSVKLFREKSGSVKDSVKVGDKIVIKDSYMTGGQYKNGDIFTVKEVQAETALFHGNVRVEEHGMSVLLKEFEVLGDEGPDIDEGDIVMYADLFHKVACYRGNGIVEISEGGGFILVPADELTLVAKAEQREDL